MSNASKGLIETQCATCNHKDVCSYKETYTKILNAVSNAYVELPCKDEKKLSMKKIVEFDFINNISITCCHYQNWTNVYRDSGGLSK